MTIQFKKMHGLGNDFVVIDITQGGDVLSKDTIESIGNRRRGVGFDQMLVMEATDNNEADFFMRIYNPDGGEAGACGNGTRCVAHLWMTENGQQSCIIETNGGLLRCGLAQDDLVKVDMGAPKLDWQSIPLSSEQDTQNVAFNDLEVPDAVCVNMGNPHAVFFVEDAEDVDLDSIGPKIEHHEYFPERTNVEFVQVLAPDKVRMRVWERGAGITEACGSGACAVGVAAIQRSLTERKVDIILDGGTLNIEWREADGHVLMTGPVAYVFDGVLNT